MNATIRAATPSDAPDIARVLNGVIAEGRHTIFDRAFSVAEERAFLSGLGGRFQDEVFLEKHLQTRP